MENNVYDYNDGGSPNNISPGFTPFPSGDHHGTGRKYYRKAAHRPCT